MENFEKGLDDFFSCPEQFLEQSSNLGTRLIANSKLLYDFMQDVKLNFLSETNSLKELLTSGFDNEQIWQEIELQNTPLLRNVKKEFRKMKENNVSFAGSLSPDNKKDFDNTHKTFNANKARGKELNMLEDEETHSSSNDDNSIENQDEIESDMEEVPVKKYKASIVDDNFFSLREMEDFLETQDRLEESKLDGDAKANDSVDNDDIDLFGEINSDEDTVEDIKYQDYFDPINKEPKEKKKKCKVKENDEEGIDFEEYDDNVEDDGTAENANESSESEESEQSAEEENYQNLSKFEKKQSEMKKKINRLEEANINEKPWQLIGEATARARPVNSLLEEHVSFDHTSVGAPVITEETTETLEDLIKQRIKDQAWDDVERKQKPSTQPYEYKKAPELNQEKSKLSLAEVYEKEYLKEQEAEKEDKENEDHILIKKLMDKLFVKLDALSNFQFTPKPPKPELKIISNTPSLQIEEITPITMAESTQLAPEEIYDKQKGDVKGSSEKTTSDKKHERKQKKLKKKFAAKEKERKEKLKTTSGKISKTSKNKVIDQLKKNSRNTIVNSKSNSDKNVKSSNDFFNRLQDEVNSTISKKKILPGQGKKKVKKTTQSLKL